MKRIIIVHQWMAGADGDWRPWLRAELEKLGHQVLVPEMPDIDTPVIEKWVGKLAEVVGEPDKDTYFVGHSIGCQTILRYLSAYCLEPLQNVGGAIFVAGWFDLQNLESDEVAQIAAPWLKPIPNFEGIKTVLPRSTLFISDNDPYGAFEYNKEQFKKIGSKIVVMHNAGHIQKQDGFEQLPEALDELKKML